VSSIRNVDYGSVINRDGVLVVRWERKGC